MKVERKIFKGIEYVLLADLPQSQRETLLQTLSQDQFIKILIDGTIVSQCLQYKDYSFWFENVFRPKMNASVDLAPQTVSLQASELVLKA